MIKLFIIERYILQIIGRKFTSGNINNTLLYLTTTMMKIKIKSNINMKLTLILIPGAHKSRFILKAASSIKCYF